MIALFIAVSPLQQTFAVSASDEASGTEFPVKDTGFEDFHEDGELLNTERENELKDSLFKVPEASPEIEEAVLPGETEEISDVNEETVISEETAGTSNADEEDPAPTEDVIINRIKEVSSPEEYFDLISGLQESERIIVDTYEELSFPEASSGVYYDGTYILCFENSEDLYKTVEMLADKGIEYSVDGTLDVCGGEIGSAPGIIDPDAKIRVAVIDTGSDLANEAYSVLGDDVSDHNGHGTAMCSSILDETDNAYIISIKAIGDDGKGHISDVYVAVQMAEELGVDYILMAVSIRNLGKYDAFISLVRNAHAVTVASAGNNASDASKYLPAGIGGVLAVGALNDDGTLRSSSNYGSAVDYYVAAGSTSEAASKALGIIIDGRGGELKTGYEDPSEISDPDPDTGSDDIEGGIAAEGSDGSQVNAYHLIMRADDEDVSFVTDNVHDSSITVYQRQIFHQSDYFRHPYNDGFGVYSDSSGGSSFSWDSHILYCIEDTKDIPDDLGYGDRQYYGSSASSDMKLIQAACAFGPTGALYDQAVQWWKEHDTGDEILPSVKNNPQMMRRAMYAVTHFVVCKAYEGAWPLSTPGDSDSVPQVFVDYYNYLKSVRNGNTDISGYILSGWWCEIYRCNSFSSSDDNKAFQLMTRGNVTEASAVSVDLAVEKSSSSATDPGYFGLAGTTYTLYRTFASVDIMQGSYELQNELKSFVLKDDGTSGSSYQTSAGGAVTYYLKETKVAAGYAVDDTIYWISISSGGNVSAGVMEPYMSGSRTLWRENYDPDRIYVSGSGAGIVHVKDAPDKALFSLNKKLGTNYAMLGGQTYSFELWDNTADIRVAAGSASVPSGDDGNTSTPVVWNGIAAGYSSAPDNSLVLIPGHTYQVMETTLTVNGNSLNTPSGWVRGTAHGKDCFHKIFDTGAGKVYDLTVTNNCSSAVKLSLVKTSSNAGLSGNNSSYSLAGTRYRLSSDPEFSSSGMIGTFSVKSDGTTDTSLTVARGKTYYLKEISAGKGFELDNSVYKIVIDNDARASVSTYSGQGKASVVNGDPILVNVKDTPLTVGFTLSKSSSDPLISGSVPNSIYDLSGTTYELYKDQECKNKAFTFVMRSDGTTGDSYKTAYGKTYYLKETAAGKGFEIDPVIYTVTVSSTGAITVNNGVAVDNGNDIRIIRLKDKPEPAYFSLTKQLGDNHTLLAGRTYLFELWDNSSGTSGVKVADGKAVIPASASYGTSVETVWSIADKTGGYKDAGDNRLSIIPGHTYQVMETVLSVDGRALETPSGWTKGNAHGKACFYRTFTAGKAGQLYSFTATNSVSVSLALTKASANRTLTDGNSAYSLSGTKYILAEDAGFQASKTVGTFTVKADGTSDRSLNVSCGKTYYLKETSAGKGYELDASVYKIVIGMDGKASVTTFSGSGLASVIQGDPVTVSVKDSPRQTQISLAKVSSSEAVTKGNPCYSLAGTSYGLYRTKDDADGGKDPLVVFSIDAGGNTNTRFRVSFGKTYYLKELTAGKGYKLDSEIISVNVAPDGSVSCGNGASVITDGSVSRIRLKDTPETVPLNISLSKVDKKGSIVHNADLKGATFRISYYAEDLGASGGNDASATVIYNVRLDGDHKVISLSDLRLLSPAGGSDPDYLNNLPSDVDGFPYGTIRIQELTAPAGYRLNDQTVRFRLGKVVSYSVENDSSYGNRNYWRHISEGELELTELPEAGYYELSKSLDDDRIRQELSGFEYEIWNIGSSSSPVQIATGISQTDGRVLWTYVVPDYYKNTDPDKLLTGTSTYRIELPASERNADGTKSPVRYQVRETVSSMNTFYGDTGIPYTCVAPVTSGKAWSRTGTYYFKTLTVSDEKITREGVTNDYLYTGLNANKCVPADNPFDITKVTFRVYNTDGGKDTLIANGSVDSKGNVDWYLVNALPGRPVPAESVNVIDGLPLGHYRVEEVWKKDYVDAYGIPVLIVEKNNSGWSKKETNSTYIYYLDLDLSDPSNDGKITELSVENEKEVGEFSLVKNVSVQGDASSVTAQLYLLSGDSEILVATGTAETDGIGTFGFTWDYKGEHISRDGLDTLILPAGKYRVVELCPVTYYKDSGVPYTYMTPEGYTARDEGGALQFFRDLELREGSYAAESMSVTNVRIEGSFDIIKVEHSGDGSPKKFVFEVYYRGNGDAVSDERILIGTTEITTYEGKGSASLTDLPEGWYEIEEKDAGSSWLTRWLNEETVTDGNKIVRLDSCNRTGSVLAIDDGIKENGKSINAVVVYNDRKPSVRTSFTDKTNKDHVASCSAAAVLEDEVTYSGLMPGRYAVTGVLMDRNSGKELLDGNGNRITGSKSFEVFTVLDEFGGTKPQSGSVKVTYVLDTALINDVTVVAFEELHELSAAGNVVASHKDINDASQTVYIPDIRTALTDKESESHVSSYSKNAVLEDKVSYSNLMPGKEYVLAGELFEKKTGKSLGIKAEKTFTPDSPDGIVTVEFIIDTTVIKGTAAVAFETLKYNGSDIAVHADINDEGQTVLIPDIRTSAYDINTEDKVTGYSPSETVRDKVSYSGLIAGKTYRIEGELIDKNTGESLGITAGSSFTPESSNGTAEVEFTVDTAALEGRTIVAFESLKYEGRTVAVHADINDTDQTLCIPEIRTTLIDTVTEDHVAGPDAKTVLTDTVSYNNLVPGKEYSLTGTLMNKKTGKELTDEKGNAYTVTSTFTPESGSGTVDISFTVDTSKINGVTVVAFEKMYYNGILIAIHTDIGDEEQTVYVPKIRTTLKDTVTKEHVASQETVTLTDTVRYSDLLPGKEYKITGYLVNRETGEKIIDADGNEITSSAVFTPDSPEGSVDIIFEFGAGLLKGKTVVAFEDLYYKEIKAASHADITDEDQTVYFPEIHTVLTDMKTDKHVSAQAETFRFTDTVSYKDLKPGSAYVMRGTLYVKSTGEMLTGADGEPVTAETGFTPETGSGTVDLVFSFEASVLKGESVVAFEELSYNGKVVAVHNDINDRDQTVDIPDIRTTFFDAAFGPDSELARSDGNVELTDRVFYKNLTPDLEYRLYLTVMVKDTGELLLDKDGKPVTAEKVFVPGKLEGYVDVSVTVDSSLLEGRSLVAFETLDHGNITLVIHADIEDRDQTVDIPEIRTTAVDADNKTHTLTYSQKVTIEDSVVYKNLAAGKTYKITGTLYNKETGEEYKDPDGNAYRSEKEFIALQSSGEETVTFTDVIVPFSKTTLVVYEELTEKETGIRIASHADLTDEDQSVRRAAVSTVATVLNSKEIWLESTAVTDITVSDSISYEGFEPGRTYRAEATLYKTDGTQIKAAGQPVLSIMEFTPETTDGEVTVNTTFSSEGLAEGDRIVVFETFYDVATKEEISTKIRTQDILVSRHEDLANESQTVTVHYRPSTGGIVPSYSAVGTVIASVAFVTAFVWFVVSRKKTEEGI